MEERKQTGLRRRSRRISTKKEMNFHATLPDIIIFHVEYITDGHVFLLLAQLSPEAYKMLHPVQNLDVHMWNIL